MDKGINTTIADYLKLIRQNYSDLDKAYLFGSYAKGKELQESDIDIALVFKDLDDSKRFDTQVQLMMLASQIDTRIEPHPISMNDLDSGNPFVAEIQRTGVELT